MFRSWREKPAIVIYDTLVFLLFLFPAIIYVTLGQTCEYLNEGILGEVGTEAAEISFMYFTVVSFGGFLIIAPVLFFAFAKSWKHHLQLFRNKEISLAEFIISVPGLSATLIGGGLAYWLGLVLFETAKYWVNQM
jgi:hypothetical protein